MRLAGRVAVVTGGARGIGAGIVRALAEEGARVAAVDRDFAAEVEIPADDPEIAWYEADVSRSAEVARVVEEVVARWQTVDILVNNAGICPFCDLLSITDEMWQETLQVNLSGAFYFAREVARVMIPRRRGVMINIGTVSSYIGTPTQVHYIASKAGLHGLTRALAVALGPHGIRVNAVLPGGVATRINRDVEQQREAWEKSGVPRGGRGFVPLMRPGTPEDMARAVVYLASDEASYITGALLPVDGGVLVAP